MAERDGRWHKLSETLHVHLDKYATRYVEELGHRCTAYKFYEKSCSYSETVAFWYWDYASVQDAVQAAKNWLMRGEVEREGGVAPVKYREGRYTCPEPELEKPGW